MSGMALNIYVISSFHQGDHIALFTVLGALIAFSLLAVLLAVNQFRKSPAEHQKDPANKKLETIVRHYDELAERHIALAQELEDAKKRNAELTIKLESAKTPSKRDKDNTEALYERLNDRINNTEQRHNELIDMIDKRLSDILDSME